MRVRAHNNINLNATRHQRDMSTAREEERATKSQIIGSLRSRIQDVINIIESLQLEDVKVKAANFESVIFDFKQTLPMLPIRASTTRSRRPAAEARNRRNNPLKRQKAKEAAAPKQLRNSAAFQRGGSAAGTSKAQPITDMWCRFLFEVACTTTSRDKYRVITGIAGRCARRHYAHAAIMPWSKFCLFACQAPSIGFMSCQSLAGFFSLEKADDLPVATPLHSVFVWPLSTVCYTPSHQANCLNDGQSCRRARLS